MGENPIKVTGIQKQPQQFSTTGIKLSTLKEENELLFKLTATKKMPLFIHLMLIKLPKVQTLMITKNYQ